MSCREKVFCDDAPAMMAAFWTGIGKQQIKCFDRSFGEQVTDGIRTFDIQNADIFEVGRFPAAFRHAPDHALGPEKVFFRIARGQFAQERTVTAAKIDLQRCDASKDREQVKRRDVCLRDQFDHGTRMAPLRSYSSLATAKTGLRKRYAVCFGVAKPISNIATASPACT